MSELLMKISSYNVNLIFSTIENNELFKEFYNSYYINGIKISDIIYDGHGGYYVPFRSLNDREDIEDYLEFEEIIVDNRLDEGQFYF